MAESNSRKGIVDYIDREIIVVSIPNDGNVTAGWEPGSTVVVNSASYAQGPSAQQVILVTVPEAKKADEGEKKKPQWDPFKKF